MSSEAINVRRLLVAGLAVGVWLMVSGLLMAATFGYREMQEAFDSAGLSIPSGTEPFVMHTLVRLTLAFSVVGLYALLQRSMTRFGAVVAAAGFAWLLAVLLPFVVIVQWGLFSWGLAARIWAWGAGELLAAAAIARALYRD